MMKTYLSKLLVLFVILLFVPGMTLNNVLADPGKTQDRENLLAKASNEGFVKVIVHLDVPDIEQLTTAACAFNTGVDHPLGEMGNADDALSGRIFTTASNCISRFDGFPHKVSHIYKSVPFMALDVSSESLQELESMPEVLSIGEDIPVMLPDYEETNPPTLNNTTNIVGAKDAWDCDITGKGWKVAILDTGIRNTHNWFKWTEDGTAKTITERCYSNSSHCPNGNTTDSGAGSAAHYPSDHNSYDHGTHVAGIAAGNDTGDASSTATGNFGVAPGADIIAINVFSKFSGIADCGGAIAAVKCVKSFSSDQIAALDWLFANRAAHKIASVNMSLGGGKFGTSAACEVGRAAIKTSIGNLFGAGIPTCIAAGNDGFCDGVGAPGCLSNAYTVGASDDSDKEASFNNWDKDINDVWAPGVSILSSTGGSNSSTASWNGTSMATPHVAGAFALMKQNDPSSTIVPNMSKLDSTGVAVTGTNKSTACAGGLSKNRIQVDKAMEIDGCADIGFTIDDTGSMGGEIDDVSAGLSAYISFLKVLIPDPEDYPTITMHTFKDSVTHRIQSKDLDAVQVAVDALSASGGGGCPEWSLTALHENAKKLKKDSHILFATDASHNTAEPTTLIELVTLLVSKGIRVNAILTGNCSDGSFGADPASGASENPGGASTDPTIDSIASTLDTYSQITAGTSGTLVMIPEANFDTTASTQMQNMITGIMKASEVATIISITPRNIPQGSTMTVQIDGASTNFSGAPTVTFSGSGITVGTVTAVSSTRLQAQVTVADDAVNGLRSVTVNTNLGGSTIETANSEDIANITTEAFATITGITPNSGSAGETLNVSVFGINTAFTGESTLDLGADITVNSVGADSDAFFNTVDKPFSATELTANITIADDATIGARNVSVTTDFDTVYESMTGPFFILAEAPAIPRLVSVIPNSGVRDQTLNVFVVGADTNFVDGTSVGDFTGGTGVTVNSTTVTSPTQASMNVTIAADAAFGFRNVNVTTGGEVASRIDGFNVTIPSRDELFIDIGHTLGIWTTPDGGTTWTNPVPTNHPDIDTGAIALGDTDGNGMDDLFIDFGHTLGIWTTPDGGTTWTNFLPTNSRPDIDTGAIALGDTDGDGRDEVFIDFGHTLGIWTTSDGTTWTNFLPTNHPDIDTGAIALGDTDGNGRDEMFIDLGHTFGIWTTPDGGTTWTNFVPTNNPAVDTGAIALGDTDGDGMDDLFVDFGHTLGIWTTPDSGTTWTRSRDTNDPDIDTGAIALGDTDGDGRDEVFADLGHTSGIWTTPDGTTWTNLVPTDHPVVDTGAIALGDTDGS